jgi:hypothetical protein
VESLTATSLKISLRYIMRRTNVTIRNRSCMRHIT